MKACAVLLSGVVLFILAAFGAQAAATTDAAKRVALVIGNSKYVNAVPLPNPANDAQLIASTLRNAGFEVIEGVDQDNAGMHSLISRFTEESYNADLAVIFYAGHGMQVARAFILSAGMDSVLPLMSVQRAKRSSFDRSAVCIASSIALRIVASTSAMLSKNLPTSAKGRARRCRTGGAGCIASLSAWAGSWSALPVEMA